MSKIKIICTLGPKSVNRSLLKFFNNKIDLLRLNLSHLTINKLIQNIKFIKKNSTIPICIDAEGAQIRTKVKKEKHYRSGQNLKILNTGGNFCLYPENVYSQLKINDILNILFLFFSNLLNLIISFIEFVKDKAKKFILNFLLISIALKSFFVK